MASSRDAVRHQPLSTNENDIDDTLLDELEEELYVVFFPGALCVVVPCPVFL